MKSATRSIIKLTVLAAWASTLLSGCIVPPPGPPSHEEHDGDYRGDHHDDRGW